MGDDISLEEVAAEYASTLRDLDCNSKPLISTLTMLADDYQAHVRTIVSVIERHIVEAHPKKKLPGLYLIDSICKNIGGVYVPTFAGNIVSLFAGVFEKVDEGTRAQMYKLRQTWSDIFSQVKMHMLDRRVHGIDPAWPVADGGGARAVPSQPTRTVHVNPNVLRMTEIPSEADLASIITQPGLQKVQPKPAASASDLEELRMRSHLLMKKKELFELTAKNLEMELRNVQATFEELTRTYFASRPGVTEYGSDFKMEQLNCQIRVETIRLRQQENARQMEEINKEMTTFQPITALHGTPTIPPPTIVVPPALVRPAVAPALIAAPPQPRVMTVTPVPKGDVEQKTASASAAPVERGSRDPRRNRDPRSAAATRIELEVPPPTASHRQPLLPSPAKETVSDTSSAKVPKDPRVRVSGSRVRDVPVSDETPVETAQRSSPAPVATPPRVKTDSPIRSSKSPIRSGKSRSPSRGTRNTSPVRSSTDRSPGRGSWSPPRGSGAPLPQVKKTSSPTVNKADNPQQSSPRGKPKRRGGKNKREESTDSGRSETRKKELSPPALDERSSKGLKAAELVPEIPVVSVQEHGDVDLRTTLVLPNVISLPTPVSPIHEDEDLRLFGAEDIDMRKLPSLVERLSAAVRHKKEKARASEPEEPEVPVPPPPPMPKKNKDEPLVAPPPPKLPKIPRKPKAEIEKEQEEERKKKEEGARKRERSPVSKRDRSPVPKRERSPIRKRERSPVDLRSPPRKRERSPVGARSPPRKREREVSPPAVKGVLTDWDNRSRSPLLRNPGGESSPNRRGWKAIKEDQEKYPGQEFDRRRDREPIQERMLIHRQDRPPARVPYNGPEGKRGRGGHGDRGRRRRDDDDSADFIIEQAEEQMSQGIITKRQFDDIFNDVFRRRESRMFREAQRRDGFDMPPPFAPGPPMPMRGRPLLPAPMEPPLLQMGPRPPMDPRPLLGPGLGVRGPPQRPLLPPSIGLLGPPGSAPPGSGPPMVEFDHKVINIDGVPREIRFYGETAVALMMPTDPRELSFMPEERPRPFHVDGQLVGQIRVGDEYKEFFFGGRNHMVRIGAPTREIFVEGKGFEFMFEGPDVPVVIDGVRCHLRVSGPRPRVKIGEVSRLDLIAGKTQMIVNGDKVVPVYLDATEQKFDIRGVVHSLRFENALLTALFDGIPHKPLFDGPPTRVLLNGYPHYIRFLGLPEGVVPGRIVIAGMKSEPAIPSLMDKKIPPLPLPSPGKRKLDRIAASMAVVPAPAADYSLESESVAPPQLDVHDLFSKLLATGLVKKVEKAPPVPEPAKEVTEDIILKVQTEALFSVELRPNSLRIRRKPIIDMLYMGVQCNSCGLRFPVERTCQYSQHLDWHFRQNRREKAIGRKPQSRSWYYLTTDWMKFEEFGDEKGWFEGADNSDNDSESSTPEPQELPTIPVDNENPEMNRCNVCREPFDQFFHEEFEEWRLRDALRVDDKSFHSMCHEDFKSHIDPGLLPGLDVNQEEPEETKPEPDNKEEISEIKVEEVKSEPDVKEEVKPEEVVKVEVKTEKSEAKQELMDVEVQVVPVEKTKPEPIEVELEDTPDEYFPPSAETSPPTPIVDEVRIKEEPVDRDELATPVEDEKLCSVSASIDFVESEDRMVVSLDGNLEMRDTSAAPVVPRIRFNITAPSLKQKEPEKTEIETPPQWKRKEIEQESSSTEELAPGEEPPVTLKPRMLGRKFKQMPMQTKGTEQSGLCSIM